jgi:hypothetical protein
MSLGALPALCGTAKRTGEAVLFLEFSCFWTADKKSEPERPSLASTAGTEGPSPTTLHSPTAAPTNLSLSGTHNGTRPPNTTPDVN